jgi:hypothetical protein
VLAWMRSGSSGSAPAAGCCCQRQLRTDIHHKC